MMNKVTPLYTSNVRAERISMLRLMLDIGSTIFTYQTNSSYAGKDPFMEHPELNDKIDRVQMDFEIYGNNEEIEAIHQFMKALIVDKDVKNLGKAFDILMPMVRTNLRNELGIED